MAMNLRIPEEMNDRLRAAAQSEGRAMQQVVIMAIDEYLTRRQAGRYREAFTRIAERDAELLDRLARA